MFFFSFHLLRLLPARHVNTVRTGRHQNTMSVCHEVSEKVIISEPTWTQVRTPAWPEFTVFSRFNLKHKQRPTQNKTKKQSKFSNKAKDKAESTCTKYIRTQSKWNFFLEELSIQASPYGILIEDNLWGISELSLCSDSKFKSGETE